MNGQINPSLRAKPVNPIQPLNAEPVNGYNNRKEDY